MNRRAKIVLLSVLLLVVLVFVSFSYVVLTIDPFKWGLAQSDKFSWSKFENVKKGERIVDVIDRLGRPIRPPEPLTALDSRDPCASRGCRKYLFAGGLWGPTYKEAIVVTDRDGIVIQSQARQEY